MTDPIATVDPIPHLPLPLLPSDPIPPAPTRSSPPGSTIDFLPDFSGYSWVAYAASSLLVISHFPSPLSPDEVLIGPIFRQVFELSSAVTAVSWSPVSPSMGELAAAVENCVCLFQHDSASSAGSFCWSQNAVLVQCTKVEAVEWTGSGNGIIAGGIEVVLWRNNSKSWEIAWKLKAECPQTLVSATWSVEGPFATAAYHSDPQIEGSMVDAVSKCVFVCWSTGKSDYTKAELPHPLSVSMIQWRPLTGRQLNRDGKHSRRQLLLTCCLDGTVRLWCEMDNGRVRKTGKDTIDRETARRSFCVVAVIEINQALNGTLGMDVYVLWTTEIWGLLKTGDGVDQILSTEGLEHDKAGRCEWLVGFGPEKLVYFWAIHCLDDISPMRFPRVTLWRRQELQGLEEGECCGTSFSNSKNRLLLNKFVMLRNRLSGPPIMCSLIHLLPCDSLVWSLLHTKASSNIEDTSPSKSRTDGFLSCSASGILNLGGHAGKILQVAAHPDSCEVELAVSLDSNGLLLFWSLTTISNGILGCPSLLPTWKLCGKLVIQDSCPKYTCLRWAPSVLNDELFLLMGHIGGIDCFIVTIHHNKAENIECHYLFTIPFTGHGPYEDGPTNIFSIPLSSTCDKTFKYNKFMLLGIWMKEFRALSWEMTFHCSDLSASYCECNFHTKDGSEGSTWMFEGAFSGKRYRLGVNPCSSHLPDPHYHDQVTSFAVVCPGSLTHNQQKLDSINDMYGSYPAYIMATGCSDGSLKLWRSNAGKASTPHVPWELVGMFVAHQGPVSSICLTDCGQKIATVCVEHHLNTVSTLHIWHSVRLTCAGTFMLEDTLFLDKGVIALNWLALGNGQLLLGVCMQNELRVYATKRFGSHNLLGSEKYSKMDIWVCIAFTHTLPPIHDFHWGPKAAPVVIHDNYFHVSCQWLFHIPKEHKAKCHLNYIEESFPHCDDRANEEILSAVFTDCDIGNFKQSCESQPSVEMHKKNDFPASSLFIARDRLKCDSGSKIGLWSLPEVVERFSGSLPSYHPETLLMNIFSGNWKRAYMAVRHLVECLTSNYATKMKNISTKTCCIIPEILLSDYFDGSLFRNSTYKGFQWGGDLTTTSSQFQSSMFQFASDSESFASNNIFPSSSKKSELSGFVETLENLHQLAAITNTEKNQIVAITDLLSELSTSQTSAYESLDEPGRRFWVALRFQQLHFFRMTGRPASMKELIVDSRLIVWAYHSDSQEILFGSFLPNEPTWQEMRAIGVGYWFTNTTQLRAWMEKLARSQYLKNKDPKDCALLYIALNRLRVLAGLFKISKDEKDKPLVAFLARNFQEEKNKAAALKNAYVLMGRHQLELAIAFFLLGGDTYSALNVCSKNLGDEQLAIVISQLVEERGGPLQHHLITKFLLPSSIEKRDYWLASLLEWEMGNYLQSFFSMLGFQINTMAEKSVFSSKHVAFVEPNIGLYCQMLASKNSLRNAVGEQNTAVLSRWATLMTSTALKRCGLPLEALECLSSSMSVIGSRDDGRWSDDVSSFEILNGILKPSPQDSSNWLSGDAAFQLESHDKLDLALPYFSKLLIEHPSWPGNIVESVGASACSKEYEIHEYEELLENFRHKFFRGLSQFDQRFSLTPAHVVSLMFVSLCNHGLLFMGYDILDGSASQDQSQDKHYKVDSFILYPLLRMPLLKATNEISLLFSRFITACSITCPQTKLRNIDHDMSANNRSKWLDTWGYFFQGLMPSLLSLRAALRFISSSITKDLMMEPLMILDLFEFYVHFASAWLQKNSKVLLLMVQPLLITLTNGHAPYEADVTNMRKLLPQIEELVAHNISMDDRGKGLQASNCVQNKLARDMVHSMPEEERWQIIGTCLWQHMSSFVKQKFEKLDDKCLPGVSIRKLSSYASYYTNLEYDGNNITEEIRLVSLSLAELLKTTLTHLSSYHVKQLASFIQQKVENGLQVMTLLWLKESSQLQSRDLCEGTVNIEVMKSKDESSISELLWDICADSKIIYEGFKHGKVNLSHSFDQKLSNAWSDKYIGLEVHEREGSNTYDGMLRNSSASSESESPAGGLIRSGPAFPSSWQKEATLTKEVISFKNPKEVYKRSGELLEALCVNSIDQRQAVLASNRKGILFFNWEDGSTFTDQSDYIWSIADWPQNGWAGSESTPVPTCVSPGVGLGSERGAHLGLGGATVGVGSLVRPGRDLTGGGAFGIPGYAGMGASGLGWEIQQDFEEFVDAPPTVENISTRAFSGHPSRPFFLVGSSNTHIYLWEFGKDKATATYGVLPAANVPPPYALASISALRFDYCGHRFATAALDGTVCTWQLEVGGRSNICPTESSLCFNNHASDVTYVSGGSVIAAAGNSSNGVNVVIWDTLAPPSTSRASIICHEGGARSLAVFDNDIGSGSISPLIVTGGKGGDVGLHDFRYIATGKSKRNRHADIGESIGSSSSSDIQTGITKNVGEQNRNGMLWYIPKAHSGSITKICTIPNTSLFLTGSKDGDVKLWDAKRAKLVYHWSKLHERHTFLQPSSRGFGGLVRAAVTDIQVLSHGFLTCGGDGIVKLVELKQ
ncbi:hypothetical protein I3843_01G073200 [Carya illinoinensis]|nr:hypothetical protein I3843_01G073200 [Carya illinoinensis]KAG7994738.1 hypothetical protein I3843_01G073200 [Carya illinoinensis]KAG7994739.1 hypothetical protein I3843_01G073200 [Carya illinoinensis]